MFITVYTCRVALDITLHIVTRRWFGYMETIWTVMHIRLILNQVVRLYKFNLLNKQNWNAEPEGD